MKDLEHANKAPHASLSALRHFVLGVVDPIVQRMRPKAMGMGYGDFKEQGLGPIAQTEMEVTVWVPGLNV